MNHVDTFDCLCRAHDIFIDVSLIVLKLMISARELDEYMDLAVIDLSIIQFLPVNLLVCPDCKL